MKLAVLGLAAAAATFPWVFHSRRGNFWARTSLVAGGLGLLGFYGRGRASPPDDPGDTRAAAGRPVPLPFGTPGPLSPRRRGRVRGKAAPELPRLRDVASGLVSAALLYGVFQVGDRLARRILPFGAAEIAWIYRLRRLAPRWMIGLLLAVVIAPCEEIFWRGLLQRALMRRLGVARGTAAAALGYAGIHLTTGNLTLTGAAAVAGLAWGAQYALQRRLLPSIVSHVAWDLWTFLIAPTPGGMADGGEGR